MGSSAIVRHVPHHRNMGRPETVLASGTSLMGAHRDHVGWTVGHPGARPGGPAVGMVHRGLVASVSGRPRAKVAGHKRRLPSGRVVRVRKHVRTVAYGRPRAGARGMFQARRAMRHAMGRQANGRPVRKRHPHRKAMIAGTVGLGVLEMACWVVFRSVGLGLGIVAVVASAGAIGTRRATAQPRRRKKSTGRPSTGGRPRQAGQQRRAGGARGQATVSDLFREGKGRTKYTTKGTRASRERRSGS